MPTLMPIREEWKRHRLYIRLRALQAELSTYFVHTHAGPKISQLEVAMSVQKHVVWFHISATSKSHSRNCHLDFSFVFHLDLGLNQSDVKHN